MRLALALAVLATAGCVSAPAVRPASDAAVTPAAEAAASGAGTPATAVQDEKDRVETRPRNAAAVSLQADADRQRAAGDLERAAATLERALRIDSRDPLLWLALAEVRLDQGDAGQAAGLARRAETLADPVSPEAARARALAARAGGG